MSKISAVFSDVGGVLLTNGWDHTQRSAFVKQFGVEAADFETRHQMLASALDCGQIDIDHYLERTVFYRDRPFPKQQALDFMYAQSAALPGSLEVLERIALAKKVSLATLNNESRELNLYRIEKFGLRNYFSAFFSSCYAGVAKPHAEIYQLALEISQRQPDECVFIDDRMPNLETAQYLGIRTIHFQRPAQLEAELRALGVQF